MSKKERGKFVVFYGINNLGKSTQAHLLVQKLKDNGLLAEYLKYPIYELEPSGSILNNYLRLGNTYQLSSREAQIIFCLNRTQYQKQILEKLEQGINIIAEDYTGTGIAWGRGAGIDKNFLEEINSHLLKEDLAILFDGERFKEAIEKNHKHEENEFFTQKVRDIHLEMGQENNWKKVNANLNIEEVAGEIIKIIKNHAFLNIN